MSHTICLLRLTKMWKGIFYLPEHKKVITVKAIYQ